MPEPPGSVTGLLNSEFPSREEVAHIYTRLMPLLSQFLVRKGLQQEVAEEAAQATLIKLLLEWDQRPRSFPDRQAFLSYCVTTAQRDLWKIAKRSPDSGGMPLVDEPTVVSTVSEVIWREDFEELQRSLQSFYASLTDVQKKIFDMKLEQYTISTIAESTQLTVDKVRGHLRSMMRRVPGLDRKHTFRELGPGTLIRGVLRALLDDYTDD